MSGQSGTTLIEVLVTTLLSAVLATMGVALCRSMVHAVHDHERSSSAQQAAATVLDLMIRDIQTAGRAASPGAVSRLRLATTTRLQLASDRNADGDTDDANERITYALNDSRGMLTRSSGDGSPQPLLRGVAPGGLRFRYVGNGGPVAAPGSDETALQGVAAIGIEVLVDNGLSGPSRCTRFAALRNR